MWFYTIFILIFSSQYVVGQFGSFKQDFGYVTVREGAHMFYWLFYTTADVPNYTDRPLVVWLQGGPGGSSTGIGNFEILGPLDLSLQERNYTWVKNFNVLFVDNPVGTGFSYVDDLQHLTTTNDEIALDFVNLMRGFYNDHPEFRGVPLYIYGQSYGGKMAIDMGIRMHEAEQAGTIGSNLRGVAMGNAWISPVDATLTWGPLLLAAGLVDQDGHDEIQSHAREAERLFNEGLYEQSTMQWAATQQAVFRGTTRVDFYNILTKMPVPNSIPDTSDGAYEFSKNMMIRNGISELSSETRQEEYNLSVLMNTLVKEALNIPQHVIWGSQSGAVFDYLRGDFMKPVTAGIEKLLTETDIILTKYNGNLDLICDTPGQILWVDRLQWPGAEGYKKAPRLPIWENDKLEGYYKSYGNFRFFWINVAGHSVPRDNPAGTNAFLRDMTSFG
ncbi:retinoid-inducible serine carboxypeptidase-like isoform X1 [Helicoverpa zea]|uniref:retinoid-inducible serine carboxypeptidase-like isoform X1 n=1 Tax=Helicoverpa zea TaxID=7113 RepID=UPI001F56D71B|nr:retinoid-inducible serine carboxypeptidase-like isoform X1 [Helicoverpa zea]XP_047019710.1 retinoid-inducible serine carboxypeptidase-like isoform X1 [Helicoverpa zea]